VGYPGGGTTNELPSDGLGWGGRAKPGECLGEKLKKQKKLTTQQRRREYSRGDAKKPTPVFPKKRRKSSPRIFRETASVWGQTKQKGNCTQKVGITEM